MVEHEDGSGAVFLWGMAAWCWSTGDVAGRRLAAVQLTETDAATARATAAGFGVEEPTLWRWRAAYRREGTVGLLAKKKGPKRPSKLTAEIVSEIASLRDEGLSLRAIGARVGVSHDSVLRALGTEGSRPGPSGQSEGADLIPLAKPAPRDAEREAAHRGMLEEAAPVICEGASLPFVGALVILPGIVATGLLEVATACYGAGRRVGGTTRAAFYGLRSLVLCVVFSLLLGECRTEGLTRLDPEAIGRLLGLDRAPEVSRLRFRMAELAREEHADELISGLARRHVDAHPEAVGLLYVDGHVRAYHGGKDLSKAHVARMRIAMPAEVDTWVCDAFGDGLLVWQATPGASLAGELKLVARAVRELLGEEARPTICFDRGGWSPKLFAELDQAGFCLLTYRKGPAELLARDAFALHGFTDDLGQKRHYLLCDRAVTLSYEAGRRSFVCREITRLDEATGHQTQIITTRKDPDPALIAHAMFSRWREENFFRYMRQHYGLDALDAYETTPDDPDRTVANPKRRDADRSVREARSAIAAAEAREGRSALEGQQTSAELAVSAFK